MCCSSARLQAVSTSSCMRRWALGSSDSVMIYPIGPCKTLVQVIQVIRNESFLVLFEEYRLCSRGPRHLSAGFCLADFAKLCCWSCIRSDSACYSNFIYTFPQNPMYNTEISKSIKIISNVTDITNILSVTNTKAFPNATQMPCSPPCACLRQLGEARWKTVVQKCPKKHREHCHSQKSSDTKSSPTLWRLKVTYTSCLAETGQKNIQTGFPVSTCQFPIFQWWSHSGSNHQQSHSCKSLSWWPVPSLSWPKGNDWNNPQITLVYWEV